MVQASNMPPVKRMKVEKVAGDWEDDAASDESLDVDAVLAGITSQQHGKMGFDENSRKQRSSQSPPHGQKAGFPLLSTQSLESRKGDRIECKAPQIDRAKQAKSDQVRRDALRKNAEALKQKQLTIKKALTAVDTGSGSNSKVVFDSDDEQDLMNSSGIQDSGSVKKLTKEGAGNRKLGLFDSDSEADQDAGEEQFQLRPQFEGKGGKELFKLQSRFGTDTRFRVDERFADSDNDDGEREEEHLQEATPASVDEFAEERRKTLAVLEKVIGARAPKQATKAHKFSQISRYDPTREDHSKFEIAPAPIKPTDSSSMREKSRERLEQGELRNTAEPVSALPQVSKEKFFEVSTDLKDAFDKNASGAGSFSFLSTFGSGQSEAPVTIQHKYAVEPVTRQALPKPWQNDEDYSSEEDEGAHGGARGGTRLTSGKGQPTTAAKLASHRFFFTADDKRIAEGVEEFWRRQDEDTVRQQWLHQRPAIVEVSRLRRKEALRRESHDRQRKHKHSNFKKRTK